MIPASPAGCFDGISAPDQAGDGAFTRIAGRGLLRMTLLRMTRIFRFSRIFALGALLPLLCMGFPAHAADPAGPDTSPSNLDHLWSSYQSQGLKIDHLITDWDDSRYFRPTPDDSDAIADQSLFDGSPAHAPWGPRGFSFALGVPAESDAANEDIQSLRELSDGSPHLVVSWQGEFADRAGRYQVSALGRKLDVEGVHDGVAVDAEMLGWGVQLAGGWRFGDLFAALRVTLGDGIDSLILKRFGSDVEVSSSGRVETLESISILPSLNYSIDKRSDIRLALGRYESRDGEAATGIETLDTINLGYTWSPWPATRIGVEVVGKDFEGASSDEDSTEIKIGAEKRF